MSLAVVAISVLFGLGIGTLLGILGGYFGGAIDALIMRIGDIFLGFPLILFAVLFAAVFGPSFTNVVIILALGMWARFARIARAEALSVRQKEFVEAARAVGASNFRIMRYHVLPHQINSLMITISLQAAWAVVVESSLSFLGAGVPPPIPTWGGMVSEGREFVTTAWWVPFFPALLIVLLVLSLNLLGDWLRDELDPRLRNLG
jgi:peptide/nickel transport system permease protein